MMAKLSASLVWGPKFIVPRQSRLTCRPVRPRDVYCMLLLLPYVPVGNAPSSKVEAIAMSPLSVGTKGTPEVGGDHHPIADGSKDSAHDLPVHERIGCSPFSASVGPDRNLKSLFAGRRIG